MKDIKLSSVVFAFVLLTAVPAFGRDVYSPIIGAWRMTSLQVTNLDGSVTKVPYSGQVVFSKGGTLSVQAMDDDPNAAPTPYTTNGYEAYYGPVHVNTKEKTFTITVQSSLVRNLIGQNLTRVFEVRGRQLLNKSADPKETWLVTYERM